MPDVMEKSSDNPKPVSPSGRANLSADYKYRLALQYTHVAVWEWDLKTDLVDCDSVFHQLFDIPEGTTVRAETILDAIHPDDLSVVQNALAACFENDDVIYDCRFRIPLRNGDWRWLAARGQVIARDADGAVAKVIGINFDLTEQVGYEERIHAVAGEMRHRVKNSLAMVNALAGATARETTDIADFLTRFRGRVDAIAAAQNVNANSDDVLTSTLVAAVEGGLSPFVTSADWSNRITIDNLADLPLGASLSQAITLCIYEFATNAVKHGALKNAEGSIAISAQASGEALILLWVENRPMDAIPDQPDSGFGSQLIERLVRAEGGRFERDFSEAGMRIAMRFPLG